LGEMVPDRRDRSDTGLLPARIALAANRRRPQTGKWRRYRPNLPGCLNDLMTVESGDVIWWSATQCGTALTATC
jgi:hypothetical protein